MTVEIQSKIDALKNDLSESFKGVKKHSINVPAIISFYGEGLEKGYNIAQSELDEVKEHNNGIHDKLQKKTNENIEQHFEIERYKQMYHDACEVGRKEIVKTDNALSNIERMKSSLNKIMDLAEDGASLTLIYNEAELALEK